MKRLVVVAALLFCVAPARAFCPCYAPGSASNSANCGVAAAPGKNPTVAAWQPIFQLVSGGPAAWGAQGPPVPDIGEGCGKPEPRKMVTPVFPCELLRAIAMQETGWRQFCVPDTPADEVGPPERTIISFDCGYGVGQVTSGMHGGETPAFDRARVAGDPTYNLATGTLILADKWRATNCVGDNQPALVEDWYVATWAYNGLAFVNNPNNPNYDAHRPPCDASAGCGGRPYQERIWGWMEFPPTAQHWPKLAPAYPNRGDIASTGVPANLPEPSCAGPTDCTQKRAVHRSACLGGGPPAGGGDGGVVDGGVGGGSDGAADGGGAVGGEGGCGCAVGGVDTRSTSGAAAALLFGVVMIWSGPRRRRRIATSGRCR